MKPRPWRRSCAALLVAIAAAGRLGGQERPTPQEASLFLLLPVGARASGAGGAMATHAGSTEAIWWNPAGLAAIRRAELSLNHAQSVLGTGDAIAAALKTRIGVFSVGLNLLQNEGGDVTEDSVSLGNVFLRNVALVGSYSAALGRHVRVGVSWKEVQLRYDCSGECPPNPTVPSSTSAVDVGLQVEREIRGIPVSVGAVLRHLGTRLSREDLDAPGPRRLQIGASARYPLPAALAPDSWIGVAADLVVGGATDRDRALPRVGAELAWAGSVFLRGGYVVESADSEAGGPSLGIGFRVRRRLQVDFSRAFTGLSADAGSPPVQLGLRFEF